MTSQLSAAADTLRTQASAWRNVLSQTNLIELPIPEINQSTKQLASQALDNIDLAVAQTKRMAKGKDPSDERSFMLLEDGINISRSRQASSLAYQLADSSGKLADMIERSGKSKYVTAIERTADVLLKDNEDRLVSIREAFKEFTKADDQQ